MSSILIAAPWCPHFIYSIITQRYNCARKYWNIYFSFLLCELMKWAALWKTANQSRAQHWAAEWNNQSEQSSTLLFMTLPNSQHSISQYLHKNVDGIGMTNDINGYHRSRTYEEPLLCECSITLRCLIVTWWYDRTLQRCVQSCTTPPGTFAHTFLHSPQADAWSTHSADLSCQATPPVLRTKRTQTLSEIV